MLPLLAKVLATNMVGILGNHSAALCVNGAQVGVVEERGRVGSGAPLRKIMQ